MPKSLISKNNGYSVIVTINLDDTKWRSFSPNFLPPFNAEESLRQCSSFKEGLFPGSTLMENTNKQTTKIIRFPNYLEFSKIMEDETHEIGNDRYLTMLFFERRKEGWGNANIVKKKGNHIGYCFNGILYNKDEPDEVKRVVYHTIYFSIVSKRQEFIELIKILMAGDALEINCEDEYFLEAFSESIKSGIEIK